MQHWRIVQVGHNVAQPDRATPPPPITFFEQLAPFRLTLPWGSPLAALGTLYPQFPPRHQ